VQDLTRLAGQRRKDLPRRGIGRMVHNCQRAFQMALEKRLRPYGITPSHWYHLNELWSHDGLTQVELANRLAIEKASSTQILEALSSMGLIERRRVIEDRRKISNHLTRKGRAFTERLIDEALVLTKQSQRGLTVDEVSVFLKVLNTLTNNLRETAGLEVESS
jgi:DNA-binding MarR family transcriptional regulator